MVAFHQRGLCYCVIFIFILVDTRIDGCALSKLANGPFILPVKYDGNVSPDIRWSGGIVDQCNSECTFPCWQFDVDRGEVDIITDQFKHFDSLTVGGMRDKVQDYVNSQIRQVCLDHGVPRNYPNCTSPSGTQWSTPTVTVLVVLLFLMMCTSIMVVVVLVARWFGTRSKFVRDCCILLQEEGYVCQNPPFTLGQWLKNCLWPSKNLEFASDSVQSNQTMQKYVIWVVYKAAVTDKNRPEWLLSTSPGLVICKRCEPSVSKELQKAGISVFCCCDCPDWKTCFLEAFKELKDSRWSDARVLTCKNLHVRLGQALQDKETARRERDRALEDRDTARQERDQALRDRNTARQERDQVLRDEDSIRRRFTARESEKKLASKGGLCLPTPVSEVGPQYYAYHSDFDGPSTSPPIQASGDNLGSSTSHPIEEDIPNALVKSKEQVDKSRGSLAVNRFERTPGNSSANREEYIGEEACEAAKTLNGPMFGKPSQSAEGELQEEQGVVEDTVTDEDNLRDPQQPL